MLKQALSTYRSSSSSVSSKTINGKTSSSLAKKEEKLKNGKGARVTFTDSTEEPAELTIEKIAQIKNLSLFCHVDATDWCPHSKVIDFLSKFFTKDVSVEIYPRYLVSEIWSKDHNCKPYNKDYYAFRAYAGPNYCKIFVDETETKESLLWVLLHELAHISLASAPYLFKAYRHLTPPDYFASDEAHERDPEEQMANAIAMSWMDMLGYGKKEYPRHWWRQRTLMNKTAGNTFYGAGLGAAYAGGTGFSKALDEKRRDELEFLKGTISKEQLDTRNMQRVRGLGLRTATGAIVGEALGRATDKTIRAVGSEMENRAKEIGKAYEQIGKRTATHSAEEFGRKVEDSRKKLPWYLRGEKTAGYSSLRNLERVNKKWQK